MKTTAILRIVACLIVAVSVLTAAGCNTLQGVGHDVRHVGGHIEHAAE